MKGCTIREILEKDCGNVDNAPVSAHFQRILKEVLAEFERKYKQLKLDENAFSIQDLFFDFGYYLLDGTLKCDGLKMRELRTAINSTIVPEKKGIFSFFRKAKQKAVYAIVNYESAETNIKKIEKDLQRHQQVC